MKVEPFEIHGIHGIIHHSSDDIIICCHGLFSNKDSQKYLEVAKLANIKGISCIRFDFRGCGQSSDDFSYKLDDKVADLQVVFEYVTNKFSKSRIALFGSSFGGMTALRFAALNEVSSIVVLSTPYKIELQGQLIDISSFVKKCSNVLVMHGSNDELVSSNHAGLIYEKVCDPKKLLFFETDHVFSDGTIRSEALNIGIRWIKQFFS
jgi:alpha/beta superfamily hydrolase